MRIWQFSNANAIFDKLFDARARDTWQNFAKKNLKKLVKSQQVILSYSFTEKRGLRRAIIYTKSLVFKIPKLLLTSTKGPTLRVSHMIVW